VGEALQLVRGGYGRKEQENIVIINREMKKEN